MKKQSKNNQNQQSTNNFEAPAKVAKTKQEIAKVAKELCLNYPTNNAIKQDKPAILEKYGLNGSDYASVIALVKLLRAGIFDGYKKEVMERIFSYDAVLKAQFSALAVDEGFVNLCQMITNKYQEDLQSFIVDNYTYIDKDSGAILHPMALMDNVKRDVIYIVYMQRDNLTAAAAISILKQSFSNFVCNLKKAASGDGQSVFRNKRSANSIAATFAAEKQPDGTYKRGKEIALTERDIRELNPDEMASVAAINREILG